MPDRPGTGLVAGLDVGGTKTLGIVTADGGRIIGRVDAATRSGSPRALLEFVTEVSASLAASAGVAVEQLDRVGVGIPGLVDPLTGSVRNAVNLGLGAEPVRLAEHLAASTGVPVVVLNDADAGALGAATLLQRRDLAYLSIGTGVAAGFVLGGALRRSRRGASGEIGHLVLDPVGPPCACGQRGCMEALVAGPAIARRWAASNGASPAAALAAAAGAGDRRAVAVLAEIAGHVASAVTLLALTIDPDTVVLGGGVTGAGRPLVDAVAAALRQRAAVASLLDDLDLAGRLVMLGPASAAGAIGAARYAGDADQRDQP